MKLVIRPKDYYDKLFIKYLKNYMIELIRNHYNKDKTSELSSELGLDIFDILIYAINNVIISEYGDAWIVEINKSIRYKEFNFGKLINFITYGNLKVKGYKLLYIIFEEVANNIDTIYERWLINGC